METGIDQPMAVDVQQQLLKNGGGAKNTIAI